MLSPGARYVSRYSCLATTSTPLPVLDDMVVHWPDQPLEMNTPSLPHAAFSLAHWRLMYGDQVTEDLPPVPLTCLL